MAKLQGELESLDIWISCIIFALANALRPNRRWKMERLLRLSWGRGIDNKIFF